MRLEHPKRLARLMAVQEVSQRELARIAGYKSHTYVQRLLKGQARTLDPEPALRIAKFLGVGLEDLFVTKLSTDTVQNERKAGRAA